MHPEWVRDDSREQEVEFDTSAFGRRGKGGGWGWRDAAHDEVALACVHGGESFNGVDAVEYNAGEISGFC